VTENQVELNIVKFLQADGWIVDRVQVGDNQMKKPRHTPGFLVLER
jgi:hypothetical protein